MDGTKKKINREELLKKMKEQEKTMGYVGGKIPNTDTGMVEIIESLRTESNLCMH